MQSRFMLPRSCWYPLVKYSEYTIVGDGDEMEESPAASSADPLSTAFEDFFSHHKETAVADDGEASGMKMESGQWQSAAHAPSVNALSPFTDSWEAIAALAAKGIDAAADTDAKRPEAEEAEQEFFGEGDEDGDGAEEEGGYEEGDGNDDDDELETLCAQAMALGLMDDTQYDALTDAIACGATTEDEALWHWRSMLDDGEPFSPPPHAHGAAVAAAASGACGGAASSSPSAGAAAPPPSLPPPLPGLRP